MGSLQEHTFCLGPDMHSTWTLGRLEYNGLTDSLVNCHAGKCFVLLVQRLCTPLSVRQMTIASAIKPLCLFTVIKVWPVQVQQI